MTFDELIKEQGKEIAYIVQKYVPSVTGKAHALTKLDACFTTAMLAARKQTVEEALKAPMPDVDEYVRIIKKGNWDEMFDFGRKSVLSHLTSLSDKTQAT